MYKKKTPGKPLRELTVSERENITKQLETLPSERVKSFMYACVNFDQETVSTHKRSQFLDLFYRETDTTEPVRRYFAREGILGWNIFDELEKFEGDTYKEFLIHLFNEGYARRMIQNITRLAHLLLPVNEVVYKKSNGEWKEWMVDVQKWFLNAFIFTPWQGKKKEEIAGEVIAEEITRYGLKVVKTTPEQDMNWMGDYLILSYTGQILALVSIKGLTWYWATQKEQEQLKEAGISYQAKNETREKRGHNRFKKEHPGAEVIIIVSDLNISNARILVISELRPLVKKLVAKIEEDSYDKDWVK